MLWDGFWGYFWGPKHRYLILALVLLGSRIPIHFTSGRMEISVHRQFQVSREPRERVTHVSQSAYCIPSNDGQECVATAVIICLFSGLAALFYVWTIHSCRHGSVQTICGVLTCKERVGDAISVKTLHGPAVAGSAGPAPPSLHVVRFTDSTRVVVSTNVGCCSWQFYR